MSRDLRFRFVSGGGLVSSLIKLGTYSRWSHVEALTDSGRMTFGAQLWGGVDFRRVTDPCYRRAVEVEVVSVPATSEQFHAFWSFLYDQRGKPYDWLAITSFIDAVKLLTYRQTRGKNWRLGREWFCSTLMLGAAEKAKLARAPEGDQLVSCSPAVFRAIVEQRQSSAVRASGFEARSDKFARDLAFKGRSLV